MKLIRVSIMALVALTCQQALAAGEDIPSLQKLIKINTSINSSVPASGFAITKTLNDLFGRGDSLYPFFKLNPKFNSDALDIYQQMSSTSNGWTQSSIKQQLSSMQSKIKFAFAALANHSQKNLKDPLQGTINYMTYGTPSFDTLYLPYIVCNGTSKCAEQPDEKTAKENAKKFNFDSFFSSTSNDKAAANGYVQYALETYKPILENASTSTKSGDSNNQNESLFQKLDETLRSFDKKSDANKFLVDNVLKNKNFQQFWLKLRTIEAQNSMTLSNFNFITAERTQQENLGSAYGLKDKNNNDIQDASPLQVERYFVDKTANNPNWYKHVKNAKPVTLQREQLMLTAQQVKLQYENKLINERMLLAMSMLNSSMLKTNKQELTAKEMQIKNAINWPDSDDDDQSNSTPPQQNPNTPPKNNAGGSGKGD